MRDTVAIVGLGYVGLPLAVAFDRAGYHVVGYDIDERHVGKLDCGVDPTDEIDDGAIEDCGVRFTSDAVHLSDANYIIVTVPTPVDDSGTPNLGAVEAAARSVGHNMSRDTTVVLESTVYPGATRDVFVPVIEECSAFEMGDGFDVGYSPERLAPGDTGHGLGDVVKVVGADDPDTRADLVDLYSEVVHAGVHSVDRLEVAETTKVIENVQRDINIALINELSIICSRLDIDTGAVLEAAGTKWNFHEYEPGLVGGHCIPVDPHYLAYRSEREGFSPKLLLTGREINKQMPKHAAEETVKALNECGKVIRECELVVLGMAYKPNVGDIRTSAVGSMLTELQEYDVRVTGYDPHADDGAMREEFNVPIVSDPDYSGADGVVVATGHDEFTDLDLPSLQADLAPNPLLVDLAGIVDGDRARDLGFTCRSL